MTEIRIMIVDDHPLMRRALKAAVETGSDMKVIGSAESGLQAQELIPELKPDVVLMDLLMPSGNGWDAIVAIRTDFPNVRILVVTSLEEEEGIVRAIKAGAQGYLTKAADTDEILEAIRTVCRDQSYLPPIIAARLMNSVRDISLDSETGSKPIEELTSREGEIFELVGQGLSNKQIGKALHISPSTVNVHIHNIMNKFGFANRRELVANAAQQNKT